VVLKDLLGKAFKDPWVLKSFQGSHPMDWVPFKALVQKVEEVGVSAFQYFLKDLASWDSDLTS